MTTTQKKPYYPRNPSDIQAVATTLTHLFHNLSVPHIITSILEHSEYWLRVSKTRHDTSHVESWNFGPFASSPPIPSSNTTGTARSPLRKVAWTVWALDAEWRFDRQRTDGKAWSYWVAVKGPAGSRKRRSEDAVDEDDGCECQSPSAREHGHRRSIAVGNAELRRDHKGDGATDVDAEKEACTRWGHRSLSTYSAMREDWLQMPQLDARPSHQVLPGKNVFSTDEDVCAVPLEDWEEGPEVARLCQKVRQKQKFHFESSIYDEGRVADWVRGLEAGDRVALTSKSPSNARECHTEGVRIELFYAWLPG